MENIVNYNSWENKAPFGALKKRQSMRISVASDENYNIQDISWVILKENVVLSKKSLVRESKKYYRGEFDGFDEIGVYFYYFEVDIEINGEIQKKYYGKNMEDGNVCEYTHENINKYQITVYDDYKVPKWYKNGIMYHIFVDRFNNGNRSKKPTDTKENSFIYGNWSDTPMYIKDSDGDIIRWDFHGGNLKGIIDKLGYLKKLGISIIYLSPIFEASSNHKYDTGDYKKIDSMFGDEEVFKELIDKAQKKGISIVLDGVFSHTGADSKYFNKYGKYEELGAYQSQSSKYSPWYNFKQHPNEYECWWDIKALPNVDELEDSYMDYIIRDKDSVIKKWTSMGVKGWRLDVADELPTEFIKTLKKELNELDSEAILTGEVWEDASNKVSYGERRSYLLGGQLDSVMGYPFRQNLLSFLKNDITSKQLNNKFMEIKENYPCEAFKSNLNLLGTHDVARIKTELNDDCEMLKLAVGVQMTFEGVPYIYYGDEAGVCGGTDPDNRRTYPWKNEDEDMIEFYKESINTRKKYEILMHGETKFIDTKNADVFAFIRYIEEEKMLIVINRSEINQKVSLNFEENILEVVDIKNSSKKYLESLFKEEGLFNIYLNNKDIKIFNIKNLIQL
ncbi:glycoside hydrolase family 13 protein [Romboutsia sedimentorum]|uniref:glycoside hydrolase family 13 protein n=1 Tax=Romboutsia sedimentorum TaxID=1368474 RepID=UPI0024DE5540|nr:glycoside hydrolase family 13 protein [Romboutsia sedimentorum]MDK2587006.1 glycoside hydrolase family 13 protein [Romboutsia sedimentorum]